MPSIIALISRAVFDREIRVAGRPATVGDVVPLTAYHSTNRRLAGLSAGGSLFLLTVRPPDNQLLLVAVLEQPTFTGDRWEAAPNTVAMADLRAVAPRLVFETGTGLTAPPEKLAMALQTPRVLTAADEALLRTTADAAGATDDGAAGVITDGVGSAAAGAGDAATAGRPVPAKRRRRGQVDPVPEAARTLAECAALAGSDPAGAFGLAVDVWRRTGWDRLADLAERLALAGESEAAGELRRLARRGELTFHTWVTAATTLPDVDRGVLLCNLHERSAPEVDALVGRMAEWEADPRVSSTLHEILRRKPWTYYSSQPAWTAIFRLLRRIGDRRLLAADWVEQDRTRPKVGRSLHDWIPEKICKHVDRLAAAPPPPPVTAEIEKLLDAIEQALPAPVVPGPAVVAPLAPPVVATTPTPLPAALRDRFDPPFTVLDVVEAHACGPRLLLGLQLRIKMDIWRRSPDPETVVVYGPDGTLEWGRLACPGAIALDPAGERVALLGAVETGTDSADVELRIVRLADDATLASWRLGKIYLWQVRWDLPSTVVATAQSAGGMLIFTAEPDTGVLRVLAVDEESAAGGDPANRWRGVRSRTGATSGPVVDPVGATAACHHHNDMYVHDLRTGRLMQAFTVGNDIPNRCDQPHPPIAHLAPAGGGRYAFASSRGGAAAPGERGSFRNLVDAATGWCVEETAAKGVNRPPARDGRMKLMATTVRVQPPGQTAASTLSLETAAYWGWADAGAVRVGARGTVRYRDLPAGAGGGGGKERVVTVFLPAVQRVAVSPDARVLAAAAGGCALIWADQSGPERVMSGVVSGITDLAVSPGGLVAAVMGPKVDLRRPDGQPAGALRGGRSPLARVAACPAHEYFTVADRDGVVFLFDDEHARTAEISCLGDGDEPTTLTWSPSGRLVAVGGASGAVVVVDAAAATVLAHHTADAPVRALAFPPGEDRVLVWTADGRLGWIALADGAAVGWRDEPTLTGLAVHPRYGWLAAGRADGQVTLHATADPDAVARPVASHLGPVTTLAFADDGLVVGSGRRGGTGSLVVYDWPPGTAPQPVPARGEGGGAR